MSTTSKFRTAHTSPKHPDNHLESIHEHSKKGPKSRGAPRRPPSSALTTWRPPAAATPPPGFESSDACRAPGRPGRIGCSPACFGKYYKEGEAFPARTGDGLAKVVDGGLEPSSRRHRQPAEVRKRMTQFFGRDARTLRSSETPRLQMGVNPCEFFLGGAQSQGTPSW